jgi:site-specific DNA-methyltransferase (adenine-specific)
MKSEVFNSDCLEAMRLMPDNAFDLAIVDPPYGLNIAKENPRVSGRWNYIPKQWDNAVPSDEYFTELKRVSVNQIIWGGNYFTLGTCRGFVIWDKNQPVDNFADSEFAWTSFDRVSKTFRYSVIRQNFVDGKIHPTQKPTALYRWLLTHYAKPFDRILDTHLGSGSSRIAAYDLGFDFVGYELDTDYFKAQEERFANHIAQPKLFVPETVEMTQGGMFES